MGSMFSEFLLGGAAMSSYEIDRSLRCNSVDTPRLSHTSVSPTNNKLCTLSIYLKRAKLSTVMSILGAGSDDIRFDGSDKLTMVINGSTTLRTSNKAFRDTTAHIHLVFKIDFNNGTAADRLRIYENGEEITSWSTNVAPATSDTFDFNVSALARYISTYNGTTWPFDGEIAEIVFVDGQALDPTNFGEFDLVTDAWKPKAYLGTYGANGFYLDFSDNSNTTSATLGKDRSGNNNDWTPTNFSVTAGIANDSLEDTPTNNFAVLSDICKHPTAGVEIRNGGLQYYSTGATYHYYALATMGVHAGEKKYFEYVSAAGTSVGVGIANDSFSSLGAAADEVNTSTGVWAYMADGNKRTGATNTAFGATYTTSDVIGVAIDATDITDVKVWWSKNGTWQASGDPATGANPAYSGILGPVLPLIKGYNNSGAGGGYANFGQRAFAATPPTGFSAICTKELAVPSVQDPETKATTFMPTGTGSAGSKTGLKFSPNGIKSTVRSAGSVTKVLFNTIRGTGKYKPTNAASAEVTDAQTVTAFNSDGYSFGTAAIINTNAATYSVFAFESDPANGIEIISWTGDGGATKAINHSMGKKPSMIFAHGMGATDTFMWHKAFAGDTYWSKFGGATFPTEVNTNSPFSAISASALTVTNNATNNLNANGVTYIAYLFADGPLFASGKYSGNGSADGPFLYCGFRPRFGMWFAPNNGQWNSVNRGIDNNYNGNASQSNEGWFTYYGATQYTGSSDLVASGIKIRTAGISYQGGTGRPWFAFAEQALKYANAV